MPCSPRYSCPAQLGSDESHSDLTCTGCAGEARRQGSRSCSKAGRQSPHPGEGRQAGVAGSSLLQPPTASALLTCVCLPGPVFATSLGRAVYAVLFDKPNKDAHLAFQPGRMAFQYDLDDPAAPDVPTTNRRSAADCPEVRLGLAAAERHAATVLERHCQRAAISGRVKVGRLSLPPTLSLSDCFAMLVPRH